MKIEEYENNQNSVYEITKINYVINNLNNEDYERIPKKVVNFFKINSDDMMYKGITDEFKDNNLNALSTMNNNELKLLKIIDYYINDKDV